MKHIYLLLFLIVSVQISNAQTVKLLPKKFFNPIGYTDNSEWNEQVFRRGHPNKDKPRNWYVIGDRDAKTYKKPNSKSSPKAQLKFKQIAYVIDEDSKWLHVATCDKLVRKRDRKLRGQITDLGWIQKDKILLWPFSLLNEHNNIHLKGFLLNKAKDINKIRKERNRKIANIYRGPNTNSKVDTLGLYDFFFVYKKENNRYLIGRNSTLNTMSVSEDLVGWVDDYKVSTWNTRIALEPNFNEEAFEERKSDKNLRVVGFATQQEADQYAKQGVIKGSPLWDNDPVKIAPRKLAKSNPRRHKGALIRFPMLERNQNFYTSGSINKLPTFALNKVFEEQEGEIDEITYAWMQEIVLKCEKKKKNLNIFFLIEGTPQNSGIQETIRKVIDELIFKTEDQINIKLGVGVYRDVEQKLINKDFELFRCNNDTKSFYNFLEKIEFENFGETDEWTDLQYAMNQSLVKGGFSQEQANILFVIGNYADFRYNIPRKITAKANNPEYLVKFSKLIDNLSKFEMNTFFIQPTLDNNLIASYVFVEKYRDLLLQVANKSFRNYRKIANIYKNTTVPPPLIPDQEIVSQKRLKLQNGIGISEIIYPGNNNQYLENYKISQFITENIKEVISHNNHIYKKFSSIINDGNGIDFEDNAGVWGADIAHILYSEIQDVENDEVAREELKKIVNEKFKLYHKVFLPNAILGSEHPPFSFVVFMPESDLRDYIHQLENLNNAIEGPIDELREVLFETFENMMHKYSGEDLSRTSVETSNIDKLRALMQGISEEGYYIGDKLGFDIGDIRDSKKMTEDEIDDLSIRIQNKYKNLKKILQKGSNYEFSYTVNGNIYYWIDANYLF